MGKALPNVAIEDISEDEFSGMLWGKKDTRLINSFKTGYINGQAEARNAIKEHETQDSRQPIGRDLVSGKPVYMEDIRGPKPTAATPTPAAAEIVEDTNQGIVDYFIQQSNNPNITPNQLISSVIEQTGLDPAAVKALYIKAQQQAARGVK